MGIIDYIGAIGYTAEGPGLPPPETESISIHFRKGVDKDDAKDLVDLALNKIAEEYGLREERDEVDLYFE